MFWESFQDRPVRRSPFIPFPCSGCGGLERVLTQTRWATQLLISGFPMFQRIPLSVSDNALRAPRYSVARPD